MLDITSELKDMFKTDYLPYRSDPIHKGLTFTFNDPPLVINNKQVVAGSFDLQESLNSSEDLVFGSCEAACLKIKFADITEDLKGKTFVLTQTVEGTIINLGTFTVDSAIEQDNRRFLEVTAYDNMRKFDRDVVSWYESLTFPTHLKHMRESLCDYCGVEYAPLPTAQGSSIKLNSNYNSKLELLKLQGKSVQNGTPTPEAKVDIVSVGDNGSIVIRVCGKNVISNNATTKTVNGIVYTVSSDGSFVANGTSTGYSSLDLSGTSVSYTETKLVLKKGLSYYNSSGMQIKFRETNGTWGGVNNNTKITPTYDMFIGYVYFEFATVSGTTFNSVALKPQLELGSTATTYEPYKGQTVTIPLTQPLRSVGSVYDRGCVKSGGVWGNERKFASVVFDGSSDENWTKATTGVSGRYRFFISATNKKPSDVSTAILCNKLTTISWNQGYSNPPTSQAISGHNSADVINVFGTMFDGMTVSDFKLWLTSNPLTVVYELATPTFEPYPQSLQDQLNKLQTYQGVTNVFTTDVLQPNMIVEYNYLPNDYMTVTKTLSTNTLNGLEVLRSLEQINGAFGHIGRDGKLQHKVLSKTVVDDTIPSGSYKKLKYEKYSTKPIEKLQINQEDGDIGAIVGNGTNCYKIQDNFLVYGKSASALQTIADNAAINILGITYVPYTCEMLGLPYLEVGDRVEFGTAITSYILGRNLKGIQSISDSVETKGNEEIIQVVSVNTEVKQLRGKTNVLSRDVEKMESTISEFDKQISVLLPGPWYPDGSLLPCQNNMTNLEYEINSKILQIAKEITTEVNNVSEQLNTKITQTATSITAQVNNLSANMSAQFAITDAEISTKVEKNGIISSINQSAESVTINANKINLTGYATFSGLSDGTTVINGGCITTGTINGDLVNVINIKAENIKSGTLNGFTINGGSVSAVTVRANRLYQNSNMVLDTSDESSLSVASSSISYSCDTSYLRMVGGTITAPDGGSLYIGQNTVKANTITQTSSRKLKKYIKAFKGSALDIINKTEVKTYLYKNENKSHKRHVGVIMEDVNEIIVNQEKSGIDIGAMTSLTWKAIQELGEELRECKELIQQYCS